MSQQFYQTSGASLKISILFHFSMIYHIAISLAMRDRLFSRRRRRAVLLRLGATGCRGTCGTIKIVFFCFRLSFFRLCVLKYFVVFVISALIIKCWCIANFRCYSRLSIRSPQFNVHVLSPIFSSFSRISSFHFFESRLNNDLFQNRSKSKTSDFVRSLGWPRSLG